MTVAKGVKFNFCEILSRCFVLFLRFLLLLLLTRNSTKCCRVVARWLGVVVVAIETVVRGGCTSRKEPRRPLRPCRWRTVRTRALSRAAESSSSTPSSPLPSTWKQRQLNVKVRNVTNGRQVKTYYFYDFRNLKPLLCRTFQVSCVPVPTTNVKRLVSSNVRDGCHWLKQKNVMLLRFFLDCSGTSFLQHTTRGCSKRARFMCNIIAAVHLNEILKYFCLQR